MQFYFIRHGQSVNNALWDRGGPRRERSPDPELTELGHKQAQHLARFLAQHCVPCEQGAQEGYGDTLSQGSPDRGDHSTLDDAQNTRGIQLTHLYCSPMIRCIETGTYISQAIGLPLRLWEHSHELGGIFYGDTETGQQVGLPGNDRDYLQTRYKDLILPEGWGIGGWWNRPFEAREQRILRAQRFHRELVRRHSDGTAPGDQEARIAVVSHAGFFDYWMHVALDWPKQKGIGFRKNNAAITRVDLGDETVVMYVNRTDHLPRELIS
jgi:2,3-bisphosphoglycerate-dependent phosphoglycerate mutase